MTELEITTSMGRTHEEQPARQPAVDFTALSGPTAVAAPWERDDPPPTAQQVDIVPNYAPIELNDHDTQRVNEMVAHAWTFATAQAASVASVPDILGSHVDMQQLEPLALPVPVYPVADGSLDVPKHYATGDDLRTATGVFDPIARIGLMELRAGFTSVDLAIASQRIAQHALAHVRTVATEEPDKDQTPQLDRWGLQRAVGPTATHGRLLDAGVVREAETRFLAQVAAADPSVVAEMRGLADVAGLGRADVLGHLFGLHRTLGGRVSMFDTDDEFERTVAPWILHGPGKRFSTHAVDQLIARTAGDIVALRHQDALGDPYEQMRRAREQGQTLLARNRLAVDIDPLYRALKAVLPPDVYIRVIRAEPSQSKGNKVSLLDALVQTRDDILFPERASIRFQTVHPTTTQPLEHGDEPDLDRLPEKTRRFVEQGRKNGPKIAELLGIITQHIPVVHFTPSAFTYWGDTERDMARFAEVAAHMGWHLEQRDDGAVSVVTDHETSLMQQGPRKKTCVAALPFAAPSAPLVTAHPRLWMAHLGRLVRDYAKHGLPYKAPPLADTSGTITDTTCSMMIFDPRAVDLKQKGNMPRVTLTGTNVLKARTHWTQSTDPRQIVGGVRYGVDQPFRCVRGTIDYDRDALEKDLGLQLVHAFPHVVELVLRTRGNEAVNVERGVQLANYVRALALGDTNLQTPPEFFVNPNFT